MPRPPPLTAAPPEQTSPARLRRQQQGGPQPPQPQAPPPPLPLSGIATLPATTGGGGGGPPPVVLHHHQRHGSVGRYSIGTDAGSVCSSATRHWVNSVSDIYGPDEIEELLEDLNRLELAAFETSDEDFDIDGSQVGGRRSNNNNNNNSGSRRHLHSRFGRHRHRSSHRSSTGSGLIGPPSPTFSDHSWDSHALYQSRAINEPDHHRVPRPHQPHRAFTAAAAASKQMTTALTGDDELEAGNEGDNDDDDDDEEEDEDARTSDQRGKNSSSSKAAARRRLRTILCYCDTSTLKTPRTLLRVLLLVSHLRRTQLSPLIAATECCFE